MMHRTPTPAAQQGAVTQDAQPAHVTDAQFWEQALDNLEKVDSMRTGLTFVFDE